MKTVEESVVTAMDGDNIDIFPFLPYILQDFWEIGTSSEIIIQLIEKHIKAPSQLHILDLGCGKGAVSIKLAEKLGCKCLGIDAIKEFIVDARTKAKEYKVDALCTFKTGDIREDIKTLEQYDVIILGAIGQVFGNYYETLTRMQPHLKENGCIIVDDGYLDDITDFEYPKSIKKKDLTEQIATAKMKILDEIIPTGVEAVEISDEHNTEYNFIVKRCNELIKQYPDKKSVFKKYIKNQETEYENLEQNLICSTLMITKTYENKIAIVLRSDLSDWQKLNITSSLAGSVAISFTEIHGKPFTNKSGDQYLPFIKQPILIYKAENETAMKRVFNRSRERNLHLGIYPESLFSTKNAEENHHMIEDFNIEQQPLAGLVIYGDTKTVYKALDKLKLHD